VIIGLIEKLSATRLSQLSERFDETGIPPFALLNEDPRYAVSNLELIPIMLETVDLFQNDVVSGKITLLGGSVEDVPIHVMVKV